MNPSPSSIYWLMISNYTQMVLAALFFATVAGAALGSLVTLVALAAHVGRAADARVAAALSVRRVAIPTPPPGPRDRPELRKALDALQNLGIDTSKLQ